LALDRQGVWLLSVVHMERADPETAVDWVSTWSSLTFSTVPLPPPGKGRAAESNKQKEYAE
ncbi:MAG: hypothetical protein KJO17_07960, partial [Acidimicrobiia bacterium]|nr:hypothetical protein [Acidimicrobiia bacterium]